MGDIADSFAAEHEQRAAIEAPLRVKIKELICAIRAEIVSPGDQTNLSCHRGITTAENCGRCSRERRIYAAIAELER